MHRKSIEAAEHLKSDDSGNDQPGGSADSPHHRHQGGPSSSESGQDSQDGIGPSTSSSKSKKKYLPSYLCNTFLQLDCNILAN